jgi:hypothetical protein
MNKQAHIGTKKIYNSKFEKIQKIGEGQYGSVYKVSLLGKF